MNKKVISQIIKLNQHFYTQVADEFSRTRQYPWQGWKKLLPIITSNFNSQNQISVLDLGSGNGRFYDFLSKNYKGKEIKYLGIDTSDELISEAKAKYGDVFQKHDVIKDIAKIKGEYDLVVAFGLTHHIPGRKNRIAWFEQMGRLVSKKGLLIFTIWSYANDNRFVKKAVRSIESPFEIAENDLEEGDYFLGWSDKKDVYRYVHQYYFEELKEVDERLGGKGLKKTNQFQTDGRRHKLNQYFVYTKE